MRTELTQWREALGLTPEQLALRMDVNVRTIYRLESGSTESPRIGLRTKLAKALGRSLAEINGAIRGTPNGHTVTNDLGLLVSLEQSSSELRWWESVVVPALLQTEDYAIAVESVGPRPAAPEEAERRATFRLQRQRVLTRRPLPLQVWALLDRSIFLRTTGGPKAMANQLDHLRAMDELPNVRIRVTPLDGRVHPAARGSFMLLTAPGAEVPYVVVTETISDVNYQGNATDVSAHLATWDHLWELSDDLAKVQLQRH